MMVRKISKLKIVSIVIFLFLFFYSLVVFFKFIGILVSGDILINFRGYFLIEGFDKKLM